MDPQASYNLGGDTATYNLAEIWPFPMNNGGGASVTSFHHNNAATNDFIASMSMNMNVINRDRDPLVMEQAPNPTPNNSSGGVRRRREEDEAVKGASTSSNGNATVIFRKLISILVFSWKFTAVKELFVRLVMVDIIIRS